MGEKIVLIFQTMKVIRYILKVIIYPVVNELTGSSPTEKLDVVRLLTVRVKLVRLVVPPIHVYVCVSIPFYLLIYICESIVHKITKT